MLGAIFPVILGLAVSGDVGHQWDHDYTPSEQCAFSDMSQTLAMQEEWHDLSYSVIKNPEVASELMRVMPDYRLAFVHADHSGVLLVGGQRLEGATPSSSQQGKYWMDTADGVRLACQSEDVRCDVDVFDDAPYGIRASTRFESGTGLMRRETLAFMDRDRCIYSIQFNSHEAEITEKAWQDVGDILMTLRNIVGGITRPNAG